MAEGRSSLRLARRLDGVGFSDIVRIRNRVLEMRAAGRPVHAFHGGEPFFDTPVPVKYAAMRAIIDNHTRYAPSSGVEALRQALAAKLRRRNGLEVTAEDVIVTAGGAQALFAAFQAVLDPGDDVLLPSPYWTPIHDMIAATGARPLLVPTERARERGLGALLEEHLTAGTRMLYYNTPQNPSGTVFSRSEAVQAARLAREHDLVVVADEAYEDLVYEGEHVSIASLPGMAERTISCYTFSKTYAMTGWRLGYAVAQEPFMTGLRKLVLYSTNGVSTPVQWAGLAALEEPGFERGERLEQYRRRRELLVEGLNGAGLACEPPAGAFYAFPSVAAIDADSRRAAEILLERAQIATIPGAVFGPHGEGHVRFSYATSIETIEAGMRALRQMFG